MISYRNAWGISPDAAAGLTNNLNAESGIKGINEVNPTSGRLAVALAGRSGLGLDGMRLRDTLDSAVSIRRPTKLTWVFSLKS